MPPVFIAIAVLLTDIAEVIGVTATLAIFNTILFVGASLVLGQISKMFSKGASSSALANQVASRTITSRQAIAPWRVMYGANRVGGIITFLHTTGSNNEQLHIVITLAGHEVNAIPAMYFDGVAVPLDGGGNAIGNFAGFVHAEFNFGSRSQATFPGLLSAAPAYWTAAHRQRGRAGVYVRLTWDQNKFPNGVPNITFDVNGRKVYDPRNGTIAYGNNAALCIADYLNNASFGLVAQTKYALASTALTNSGLTSFNAAQAVDGNVGTAGFGTSSATAGAFLLIDLGSGNSAEYRRLRLYMSASGSAASFNLDYSDDNITYHHAALNFLPDVAGWNEIELAPNGAHRYWQLFLGNTPGAGTATVNELELYTSDIDSTQLISAANTCDEAVPLLAGGSQNRFSIDGSFDTSEVPANVIGRMNSAMAGSVLYAAGKWGVYPGIWRAPTISLSDADFRGALTVQTRLTHRDLYNGVKGTFISPTNNWQPSDYPPFQDATALQEDSNEALWLDVELPFTISGAMAQRLSKIALRRVRHQITVQGQFKLTAYQVQPLDVVNLSHPRFGWTNKTFEVTACTLAYVDDGNGSLALGVDLTMREVDSTIYDWSTADEVALNTPPVTVLPQNAITQPPTGLSVSSVEVKRVVDGLRSSFISISWTSPADQFVISGGYIIVQYKKHSDTNWTDIGRQKGNVVSALIGPVVDGTLYDIQIWAENSSGVSSSVVSTSATPTGTAVTFDSGLLPVGFGKNMIPNPGFESNIVAAPVGANIPLGSPVSDNWTFEENDSNVFTAQLATSTAHSGSYSAQLLLAAGTVVPPSAGQLAGIIRSSAKLPLAVGDIVRCSGWVSLESGAAPPAGVTVTCRIQLDIFSSAGVRLGALAPVESGVLTFPEVPAFIQNAVLLPATLGGGVPAYGRFTFMLITINNNGAPATLTNSFLAHFDDMRCVIQNTAFDLTPINTSGHATTGGGALSQSGATTTILVASKTIQFGDGQITYNAGSVNPGGLGTWFVFFDDPTYSGGAVTYQASANESDVYAANGRIYCGKITTVGGGGATSPNPPGTGGGRLSLN